MASWQTTSEIEDDLFLLSDFGTQDRSLDIQLDVGNALLSSDDDSDDLGDDNNENDVKGRDPAKDQLPTSAPPKVSAIEMNRQLQELEVVFREMPTEEESISFFQNAKVKKKKQKQKFMALEPTSQVLERKNYESWKPVQLGTSDSNENQWRPVPSTSTNFHVNNKDFPAL